MIYKKTVKIAFIRIAGNPLWCFPPTLFCAFDLQLLTELALKGYATLLHICKGRTDSRPNYRRGYEMT